MEINHGRRVAAPLYNPDTSRVLPGFATGTSGITGITGITGTTVAPLASQGPGATPAFHMLLQAGPMPSLADVGLQRPLSGAPPPAISTTPAPPHPRDARHHAEGGGYSSRHAVRPPWATAEDEPVPEPSPPHRRQPSNSPHPTPPTGMPAWAMQAGPLHGSDSFAFTPPPATAAAPIITTTAPAPAPGRRAAPPPSAASPSAATPSAATPSGQAQRTPAASLWHPSGSSAASRASSAGSGESPAPTRASPMAMGGNLGGVLSQHRPGAGKGGAAAPPPRPGKAAGPRAAVPGRVTGRAGSTQDARGMEAASPPQHKQAAGVGRPPNRSVSAPRTAGDPASAASSAGVGRGLGRSPSSGAAPSKHPHTHTPGALAPAPSPSSGTARARRPAPLPTPTPTAKAGAGAAAAASKGSAWDSGEDDGPPWLSDLPATPAPEVDQGWDSSSRWGPEGHDSFSWEAAPGDATLKHGVGGAIAVDAGGEAAGGRAPSSRPGSSRSVASSAHAAVHAALGGSSWDQVGAEQHAGGAWGGHEDAGWGAQGGADSGELLWLQPAAGPATVAVGTEAEEDGRWAAPPPLSTTRRASAKASQPLRPVTPSLRVSELQGGYHGPGLSMTDTGDAASRARAAANTAIELEAAQKEVQALKAENAQLKELLEVWKSAGEVGASLPPQVAPAALQRYRAQLWQLQRQVAMMSLELKAQARVVAEAEGVADELLGRLDTLLASEPAEVTPSALTSLKRWASETAQRIKGERRQAARSLTRTGITTQQEVGGYGGSSSNSNTAAPVLAWEMPFVPAGGNRFLLPKPAPPPSEDSSPWPAPHPSDHPAAAPLSLSMSLPRLAAGVPLPPSDSAPTNVAQQHGGSSASHQVLSIPHAAQASGGVLLQSLATDPGAAASLAGGLIDLHPRLASLAVLLRAHVLPAMPWLATEAADRLQAEVAETSALLASTSATLADAVSLLPAAPAVMGAAALGGARGSEMARRSSEVAGGRDGWLWASQADSSADGEPHGAGSAQVWASPDWRWHPLLRVDVGALCTAAVALLKDRKSGPKQMVQLLISRLAPALAAASGRASLLEIELAFCCRAVTLQAEHVSHLFLTICSELEAAGARGAQSYSDSHLKNIADDDYQAAASAMVALVDAVTSLDKRPSEQGIAALLAMLSASRPQLEAGMRILAAGTALPKPGGGRGGTGNECRLVDVAALAARLAATHSNFREKSASLVAKRLRARHAAMHAAADPAGEASNRPSFTKQQPCPSMPWDHETSVPGSNSNSRPPGHTRDHDDNQAYIKRPEWQD